MAIAGRGAHVLVFPYPAQGHMIPLLDLTDHLAIKGLTITMVVTPQNLHLLNSLLSSYPSSIKSLVLPFPSIPSLPSGIENAKDLPPHTAFITMQKALGELHNPIANWFESHPSPPVAIISDMFLGWTQRLACELGIKRIVFSPSGAMALSIIYSLWLDFPRPQHDDKELNGVLSFPRIPNCPEFPWWQISPVYRSYVMEDPSGKFIKEAFHGNIASWGLIINTFSDLERVYLDHLMKELGHDRVWAALPDLSRSADNRGGSSSRPVGDVISWLDKCEDNNVVYVSFGSQAVLTNYQMEALALALEKSGVRFIWSVKEPTKVPLDGQYGVIPSGFEDRVAGKGLIIRGWAPQVQILEHRAVGAFLTHCGWNSVLEGLVAGGALLLTWPMGADQFANAKLLVDELKVAIRVCEGENTVPDSEELSKTVAESVIENRVERERAMELRRAALTAIKEGGSSVMDLDGLVKHLSGLELNGSQ